jgi:hypothetical protein
MKRTKGLFTAALLSCAAVTVHAQELQTYVQRCQDELQFTASEVKPMNCNDGWQFAQGTRSGIHDLLVHQRVNSNVDMVAACRWGDGIPFQGGNTKFLSLELIIHNRTNGGTCFFAAKDIDSTSKPVSSQIVPITNFSATNRPNANDYWLTPTQMNDKPLLSNAQSTPGYTEKLQCVRCHSQGPYIASARIAPFLARFGLLNDGHFTLSDFAPSGHYKVVGSGPPSQSSPGSHPLGNWHYLIAQNNVPASSRCSGSCHALAKSQATTSPPFTPIGDLTSPLDTAAPVLPSIKSDISELVASGGMEPGAEDSHYRWINRDQPGSDSVEVETFTASKQKFPVTNYRCGAPSWIEATAVGTGATFSSQPMSLLQNKLRSFNLRDGLVCLHSDQPSGQCNDYQLSYKCPVTEPEKWVGPYNKDTNFSDDGDHEERSKSWNEARAACGNKDPVAMRADVLWTGGIVMTVNAPNDRLAQFSPSGLVCRNSDQGSGQSCANYTVRFRGCSKPSESNLARIRNAWTSPPTFGDRYLTTTNNTDGAETRAQANNFEYPSQDWTIEYIPGGNVRLRDIWSGKYLTASSNSDMATVVVRNFDPSLQRQHWILEKYSDTEVRFKNVGSNRYLTVGNYTSDPYYAPILSQSLSNQNWASQRWIVQ